MSDSAVGKGHNNTRGGVAMKHHLIMGIEMLLLTEAAGQISELLRMAESHARSQSPRYIQVNQFPFFSLTEIQRRCQQF